MTVLSNTEVVNLFLGLRPRIVRLVLGRVKCPDTAADVVQDLYLRMPRVAGTLNNSDEVRRYLFTMARNAATDTLRARARRERLVQDLAPLVDEATIDPENEAKSRDDLRMIDALLDELPPKARSILVLSRVEGLTHPEIAARLGISESLIEKYLRRSLQLIRERLTQNTP